MLTGKTLVLAEHPASWSGYEALRKARGLGLSIVLLTRDPAQYHPTPAFPADPLAAVTQVIPADTNDVSAVARAASGLPRHPDGLMSFSDYHCAIAAAAAAELGLPGPAPEAVQAGVFKDRLRAAMRGHPASVAHRVVRSRAELAGAARELGLPLVAKPTAEGASIGVHLASTLPELAAAFEELHAVRANSKGQPCSGDVLLEEYVAGPEFSVETMSAHGTTVFYGITRKTLLPGTFVEAAHTFPALVCEVDRRRLEQAVLDMFAAVGFSHGPCHTELRLAADGARIIEMNPRQPGGYLSTLIEYACGRSPFLDGMAAAVRAGLPSGPAVAPAASWRKIFAHERGRITSVAGVAEAAARPGVMIVHLARGAGEVVQPPTDNNHAIGAVLACGAGPGVAEDAAASAAAAISIGIAPGSPW